MIRDQFIAEYIKSLKDEQSKLKDDLATATFASLYDLGKLQGRIVGLSTSLQILEALYNEQDI